MAGQRLPRKQSKRRVRRKAGKRQVWPKVAKKKEKAGPLAARAKGTPRKSRSSKVSPSFSGYDEKCFSSRLDVDLSLQRVAKVRVLVPAR